MRTTGFVFATAVTLTALSACGGSTSSTTPMGTGTGTTSGDITSYQQFAVNVQSTAAAYGTTMAGAGVTSTSCEGIHDQYDGQVRPWVSQMMQMGGHMDDFIDGHGGASDADMMCGSSTMMDELDHHRSIACTLADLGADRAEAARHAQAMNGYASHLYARCGEMLANGNTWGPMMHGCENWSATCCTPMMRAGCCAEMMGGGTMMHGSECCGVDR